MPLGQKNSPPNGEETQPEAGLQSGCNPAAIAAQSACDPRGIEPEAWLLCRDSTFHEDAPDGVLPQPLAQKYTPRKFQEVIGLETVKRYLVAFAQNPHPRKFLFMGDAGTGKMLVARLLASELRLKPYYVGAAAPYDEVLNYVSCWPSPIGGLAEMANHPGRYEQPKLSCELYYVIAELEGLSAALKRRLLHMFRGSEPVRPAIFVLTCKNLRGRDAELNQRLAAWCTRLKFSTYGAAPAIAAKAKEVYALEGGHGQPDWRSLLKRFGNDFLTLYAYMEELLVREKAEAQP